MKSNERILLQFPDRLPTNKQPTVQCRYLGDALGGAAAHHPAPGGHERHAQQQPRHHPGDEPHRR